MLHAVGSPASGRTSERRVEASSALQRACPDIVGIATGLSSARCPLQFLFSSAGHW